MIHKISLPTLLLLILFGLIITLFLAVPIRAGSEAAVPGPREKCPVCGMFVAKYPDWTTSIEFKDGSSRYFDGVMDLLKFYLAPEKYGSRATRPEMVAIRVKDYYSLEVIDGRKAFYVLGSDVLGPMGQELIPFARPADAVEFLRDHRGQRLLLFTDLAPNLLKQLEVL